MKVPFCKPALSNQDIENVVEVLKSGNLYHASICDKVEVALNEQFGQYAVLVNSCTSALILACEKALAGSDSPFIIVPDMTFCSTAHAVKLAGGIPVLCDVQANGIIDLNMLGKLLEQYDTNIFIGVDLYGQLPPWETIRKAFDRDVVIIEDAAHSFGSKNCYGIPIGTGADFTCVSFYATKVVTCADGGFVMTPDKEVAEELAQRANNGITSKASDRYTKKFEQYDVVEVGHKMMMNDFNAALLYQRISTRPEWVEEEAELRIRNADLYKQKMPELRIKPIERLAQQFDNHHLTVWICPSKRYRDGLISHCQENGVQLSVHFRSLSETHVYRKADNAENCEISRYMSERIVSLPNHSYMGALELNYVCDVITSYDKEYA